MSRSIVVAYGRDRVIGFNNTLPWAGEMPADMQRFRSLTLGLGKSATSGVLNAVIMGRSTYESIGKALPGRQNIVLTRQIGAAINGCDTAHSLDEAYTLAEAAQEVFVIGGGNVFAEALPHVDRLYVTEIDASFEGDAFFPEINPDEWQVTQREVHQSDANNNYPYEFLTYERT